MADFERDGWKITELKVQNRSNETKVKAYMRKGDDSVSPSFDAPSNLADMKVSEVAELAWREKARLFSS